MRIAALGLGILGGIFGLAGANNALQIGQLGNFLGIQGSQATIGAAVLAMVCSVVGIVGGGVVLARPRTGAVLMLLASVAGIGLIRSPYLVAGAILLSGSILAFLSKGSVPLRVGSAAAVPELPTSGVEVRTAVPDRPTSHSTIPARVGWAAALLLTVTTWWFWLFGLLALLLLALLAWVPRLGQSALAVVGWQDLPIVRNLSGFKASAALMGLVAAILLFGTYLAPRPP